MNCGASLINARAGRRLLARIRRHDADPMKVIGDYHATAMPISKADRPEVAQAFLQGLKQDRARADPAQRAGACQPCSTARAFEAYGHFYKPMLFFLWGLTPIVSQIVGRDLLPTYDLSDLPRRDVCKVHADRLSCEHSLSLTLRL